MRKFLFLILFFSEVTIGSSQERFKNYYPVNPTVFILLREAHSIGDWSKIINAALPADEKSRFLEKIERWENIIILDEGKYWAVTFHVKGNGMLSRKDDEKGLTAWEIAPEGFIGKVVYLDKQTLNVVKSPDNSIKWAPTPLFPFYVETTPIDINKIIAEKEEGMERMNVQGQPTDK